VTEPTVEPWPKPLVVKERPGNAVPYVVVPAEEIPIVRRPVLIVKVLVAL
jgi:hypothetical protein